MASEIERLADLEGFLKIASVPDWRRVRLTPVSYPGRVRPVSAAADAPAPAAAPATLSNSAEPPAAPVTPAKRRAAVVTRPRKRKNDVTRAPGAGGEDTKSGSNGAGPGDTVTAVGSNGAADKGPGSGTELNN
jgi:hypothetical protein